MSEQNNLFQIYKIKCQTQAITNACQKSRVWVWVRFQVYKCVRVSGRIGSEPINGNIRARYLNHFIGLTLYCFFARCERVERKIYNCNLTSVAQARLKVCNDFDTWP